MLKSSTYHSVIPQQYLFRSLHLELSGDQVTKLIETDTALTEDLFTHEQRQHVQEFIHES